MGKEKNKSGYLNGRFIDALDVFFVLMAVVVLALYFVSMLPNVRNRSRGLMGVIVRNRLEKNIKKIDGIRDVEVVDFYDGGVKILLYEWPGTYAIYDSETLDEICSVVEKETLVSRYSLEFSLYDGDGGERLSVPSPSETNLEPETPEPSVEIDEKDLDAIFANIDKIFH